MFANCQMGGQNMAAPDVCLVPVPSPAGPVPTPTPFVNIAMVPMAVSFAVNVLISGTPGHNMTTNEPVSNGDEAGCSPGGVMSGIIIGPCRHTMGSVGVFIGGSPATKMASPTMQNSTNAMGMTLIPSQVRVIIGR